MTTFPLEVLFLPRYDVLHSYYLNGFWEHVAPDLLRRRPDPRTNSTAWNIWPLTHPFQHVGEMDVIAGLLGVTF